LTKDVDGGSVLRDGLSSKFVACGGGNGNETSPWKGSENNGSLYLMEDGRVALFDGGLLEEAALFLMDKGGRDVGVGVGMRCTRRSGGWSGREMTTTTAGDEIIEMLKE
jgi:hypothetical protein